MRLSSFQKELLQSVWPAILFIIFFFSVYALLPTHGYAPLLSLVLSFSLGAKLFSDIRTKQAPAFKEYLKNALQVTALVSTFYLVGKMLGGYGWLGAAGLILLFVIYKMYKRWGLFMTGVREIEKSLFGMSLDKTNWKKDKPHMPKIKLRGGKRK